jgi:hypothetical protein
MWKGNRWRKMWGVFIRGSSLFDLVAMTETVLC